MKRLAGVGAATVGALLLNKLLVDRETKPPHADGGWILELSRGNLHVLEEGRADAPPLVLLHGFAGSMRWFDRLAPLLTDDWRVIRVDLLGHGGSPSPREGYELENQARLVAGALESFAVEHAVVVGHSMGGAVGVALAEQRPELVRALVVLDEGPDNSFGTTPFLAKLGFVPVVGELIHRLIGDGMVRDGYRDAFAKGFDLRAGFPDVVRDFRRMTYTSYKASADAEDAYLTATRLDERLSRLASPALVAFGEQDGFFRAEESARAFESRAATRVEVLRGVGHSPPVEAPDRLAALIRELAQTSAAVR